ncbi:MAG TPA: CoA-transferase, partial [Casimicrobiaceae bacterium]
MEKITADEAAQLVQDGDAILISGSGGGHSVPEALLAAVERRFLAERKPVGITSVSIVGIGDRAALGATHLAHEGLLKRAITSALVDSPGLVRLAAEDKIEAYTLPQGVLSQLMRDMAAGRPGLLTKTGLHTFVDPRQQGARQSPRTPPDFVEVVDLAGEEWLFFKPVPVDIGFLRGTTADEDGNVTMEEEAVLGEMLAMAQATRRAGGIVVVQVKRMARRNTLPAKEVKIPGILVDFVVVDAEQRQTYATYYDPSYSGELRIPVEDIKPLPFGPRKVIVRRAAMELFPGAICNLGAGVSTGISTIAAEEGLLDAVHLTNEQGIVGGAPITGRDSGGGQNFAA